MSGDTHGTIMLLTQTIRNNLGDANVVMDMVQTFFNIGDLENAIGLFNKLPYCHKESDRGKALLGQITFIDLVKDREYLKAGTAACAKSR